MKKGRYIVIEGVDGSGKTTQFEKLVANLGAVGVREPGGTPVAEKLRELIKDKSVTRAAHTNVWMFMAARAELMNSVVRPAVRAGETVVADRNWLSTVAYQSAEGVDTKDIYTLARLATGEFFQPDLLIFIDVSDKTRHERTLQRGGHEKDYFDGLGSDYFKRVRESYLAHLKNIAHHVIIDGNQSPNAVAKAIAESMAA